MGCCCPCCRQGQIMTWEPQVREGESAEELSVTEWIGQAIGAASMCWVGGTGNLEFDSEQASAIAAALQERVYRMVGEAVDRNLRDGLGLPAISRFTTRALLSELRTRAEENQGKPGSGWLADRVDDCLVELEPYLEARRTWPELDRDGRVRA